MTDEERAFIGIGWNFAAHGTVTHSKDEYVRVRRQGIHTNTVEGFFSILKRGMYGVYQHVSEAHLHRYLCEFDFRYNNREKLGVNDVARASLALQVPRAVALPTKQLTERSAKAERYERYRKRHWYLYDPPPVADCRLITGTGNDARSPPSLS